MPGLFACHYAARQFPHHPCLFLDRDGVIVEEVNYLHRPEDIRFIPGVLAAIARVNQSGIPIVMVTNQAGIGRGYFGWDEFHALQAFILREAEAEGEAAAAVMKARRKGWSLDEEPCEIVTVGVLIGRRSP